nr:hypothetical protein [Tanacetum cinerariifolium]GFA06077.1 hypothetical protein [Tanacetum cinerariifolium]
RFQLNAKQTDWRDDIDDEPEDQELEAHYLYMAQIQEQPESVNDTYPVEQNEHIIIDSLDMSYDREHDDHDDNDDLAKERDLLDSLIEKLKCKNKNRNEFLETSNKALVDKLKEMKKQLFAPQETISVMSQEKEAHIMFYKTHDDKEIKKVIKVKALDDIFYKIGQSVQRMNMLNRYCKTSFVKPEFLKKAQRANPRLYDIGESAKLMGLQLLQLELRFWKIPARSSRPVKSAEILWQFWASCLLRVSLDHDGSWSKWEPSL